MPTTSWLRRNKAKYAATQRSGRRARRIAMLKRYGGKCACCSESNPAFLTFDHVENDGIEQRKRMVTTHMGEWLFAQGILVVGIQVLCFNCNLAKAHNGGVCPHESLRLLAGEPAAG